MPGTVETLHILRRRWRVFAVFALLGTSAGVGYALLAPPWYAATLTVIPSQRAQESAAMSLASRLPIGIDGMSTDSQRIKDVLTSRSVADDVIEKFNLTDVYGTEFIEHTREALSGVCRTKLDKKSSVVTLTCEDKNPQRATEMAAYFGEVGNRVFARISASSAREERRFLEAQVVNARKDVEETSLKLRTFQEKHRIIDLPEQSKAVMSAMASLEGEMMSKQIELSYLTRFSSGNEPGVMQLKQQIAIMRSQLQDLAQKADSPVPQTGSASAEQQGSIFPQAMAVPALRFELEQLLREQKIRETVFALMTQRHEMARVDEARDTSTFQILDHPSLPTVRSHPKRFRVVVISFVASIMAACAWILVPGAVRRRFASTESRS